MNINNLINHINDGREIEFIYGNKKFSITYGEINGIEIISFCEFNHETTEVNTIEELCKVARYGKTISEMWESLTEKDIWVF